MTKHLILCDCMGTQRLDGKALSAATGMPCSRVHTGLCTVGQSEALRAMKEGDAVIACAQEAALFEELATEAGLDAPECVDLRDRAGWTEDADATPKMAALIAEAQLNLPATKTREVTSEGACLIIGRTAVAFPAAAMLAETLAVTVLATDDMEIPDTRAYEVAQGRLRQARGTLGAFEVTIDALRQMQPGGRGTFTLGPPRDGARTTCDIILDLTGGMPLFPAAHKRDGYLRADPGDPNLVAKAVFEAAQMVGTFEKPLHVALEPLLCAHSRAGQTGCTRCLDACPTGAITPGGDSVTVDPLICAGCGACSALCPSGAITYDAPPVEVLLRRIRTLAEAFFSAGGEAPRLLIHDRDRGAEMISLAARHARGLPSDVIPIGVEALAGVGHAEVLAALAAGFTRVEWLLSPQSDRNVIAREYALAVALSEADRLGILDLMDPEALSDHLYATRQAPRPLTPILPMGNRRQITRLAVKALQPGRTEPIPLPAGAPYGAVLVDTGACTLCLSCVSLCPSGALLDNEDAPQLRFQEDACLQCGICVTICPESAIALDPRLDPTDAALSSRVLKSEEPFACIECGALFGVKSTIDKITEKLAGKHSMFATGAAARMIQMCDNCRVQAQFHSENNPFAGKARPAVRTTDDYLSKRRDH